MSFSLIWEQGFQAFMVFIGVGLIWLRFIEPLFANRGTSVTIMIIVAVLLTIAKFSYGMLGIRKQLREAQAQIDTATAQLEEAA